VTAPTSRPTPRRAALVFVFVTVVLDMLALGMIVPVLPKLVVDFLGGDTARAAEIYGLFGTVTFVLYATYRSGWDERVLGLTLAAVGVCSMIVQGGLVQPIVTRFGERRALLAGLGFGVASFAIYGLAATGAVFWTGVPVMALWGLFGPAAQGLMTRRVRPSEQGQLQGALNGLRGITGLIGPGLFTLTFAGFIGAGRDWHLPGAPSCSPRCS
jgi:MFS family permease